MPIIGGATTFAPVRWGAMIRRCWMRNEEDKKERRLEEWWQHHRREQRVSASISATHGCERAHTTNFEASSRQNQ